MYIGVSETHMTMPALVTALPGALDMLHWVVSVFSALLPGSDARSAWLRDVMSPRADEANQENPEVAKTWIVLNGRQKGRQPKLGTHRHLVGSPSQPTGCNLAGL